MVDVGIGVGYLVDAAPRVKEDSRALLMGRGSGGEEDNGSKAGSSSMAGRFVPASGGKLFAWEFILLGDESIMTLSIQLWPTGNAEKFYV